MPWKLDPNALRRCRLAARLDRKTAAELSGLAVFTVRRHESPRTAPRHLQGSTAKAYAKTYKCELESFATWEDHVTAAHERDQAAVVVDPTAPAPGELERRAKRERELKLDEWMDTPAGRLRVIGVVILRDIHTACGLEAGNRYVATGTIGDQTHLPDPAARRIDAKSGIGAIFTLHRKVTKGLTHYTNVITREPEHTRAMLAAANANRIVSAIVRVVVAMPDGEWKGFLLKDGKGRKPFPFAFVVEDVLASPAAPEKSPRKQRAAIPSK